MLGTGKHTLVSLTVDMVKKYESEKYRIRPSERMREMLEHYLVEHRRAVAAIVERTGERDGPRFRSHASPTCPTTCPTGSGPRSPRNGTPPPYARQPPYVRFVPVEFIF